MMINTIFSNKLPRLLTKPSKTDRPEIKWRDPRPHRKSADDVVDLLPASVVNAMDIHDVATELIYVDKLNVEV